MTLRALHTLPFLTARAFISLPFQQYTSRPVRANAAESERVSSVSCTPPTVYSVIVSSPKTTCASESFHNVANDRSCPVFSSAGRRRAEKSTPVSVDPVAHDKPITTRRATSYGSTCFRCTISTARENAWDDRVLSDFRDECNIVTSHVRREGLKTFFDDLCTPLRS